MDLKGNGTLKKPPPYGIQMYKGYKNVALTRKTANFVTHHPIAKDFREWLADTLIPDESYYATLARIHQLDPDQQKVQMQDEVMAVWLGNLEFDEIRLCPFALAPPEPPLSTALPPYSSGFLRRPQKIDEISQLI